MAVSKIKPIKKSLKKALDYIINPDKTNHGTLVSSFGCTTETADLEMKLTSDRARNQGERMAYHLMQSFSPEDDITPEKAHELGKEFADRLLGGKYEYIVSTHIDKNHVHNHIICNATSFVDYKKYHMPVWHKYRMFNINDQICKENNLSVIENRSGQKGKSWYENNASLEGSSWKDKLKSVMDDAINSAADYGEFIQTMEMEGYEYKETEHVLKFKAPGQEKYTRVNENNFGKYYSKEMMLQRIEDKTFNQSIDVNKKMDHKDIPRTNNKKKKVDSINKRANLIVDISKNIKAQQSKGYEHVLVMNNINTMVFTMNYLIKNDITTLEELSEQSKKLSSMVNDLEVNKKNIVQQRKALSEKIKVSQTYIKYKKLAEQAMAEPAESLFHSLHKEEILLFGVASAYLKERQIDTHYLDVKQMISEYKVLIEKEKVLKPELKIIKEISNELEKIKSNLQHILKDEDKTKNLNLRKNKSEIER